MTTPEQLIASKRKTMIEDIIPMTDIPESPYVTTGETKNEKKLGPETGYQRPLFKKNQWYSRKTEKLITNNIIGKYVCFTYYGENKPKWDEKAMTYLVYQQELCPTTEAKHWQGYVEMNKTSRTYAIWMTLEIPGAFLQKRMAKSGKLAADYCKKDESAIKGTREEHGKISGNGQGYRTDLAAVAKEIIGGKSMKEIAEAFPTEFIKYTRGLKEFKAATETKITIPDPGITLRQWQTELINQIDLMKPSVNRRKGYWIYSKSSGTGKTTTVKYLCWKYGIDNVIIGDFRIDDLAYAYDKHKIIVFNMPRDQEFNGTHRSVLEKVTDGGIIMSRKYESKMKLMDAIVIVFANRPCPHTEMPDRFYELCLDPKDPLQDYDDDFPCQWSFRDKQQDHDPEFLPKEKAT